jgi:hypothetical protein
MTNRPETHPLRFQLLPRSPFLVFLDFFLGSQAPHPRDATPSSTIAYAATMVKRSSHPAEPAVNDVLAPHIYPPSMRR